MQLARKILLFVISSILIIPTVLADTNVTFYSSVTFTNILGLKVPLGFEQVAPLNWAIVFYNALAIGFIIFIAGFASRWSVRYSLMSIVGFGAIFWWFGWMGMYNAATNAVDEIRPLNLLILATILGAAIYLKEANKESSGASGSGGLTILNILYWFILLQTAIGIVNITGIFQNNAAVTPQAYQYNNENLQAQVTQTNNPGGILGGIMADASWLTTAMTTAYNTIFQVITGIAGYPGVLTNAYPWITQSPMGMAFVLALGVIIILLDGWFLFLVIVKPPPIDNLNPG